MNILISEEALERHLNWTSQAGRRSGLKEAVDILNKESAQLFVSRNDDMARSFRDMADRLKIVAKQADELATIEQERYEELKRLGEVSESLEEDDDPEAYGNNSVDGNGTPRR